MYRTILTIFMITTMSFFLSCTKKSENSLLWKISGNDLKKASYLYGTIHMTCDYKLTKKLKKAFEETDQLVLEIDMNDPKLKSEMMQHVLLKDGKTIQNMLSKEDHSKLADFFRDQVGMDLKFFDKMKPFVITSALASKVIDCNNPTAYETEFTKITEDQNEKVLALETIVEQLSFFDSIPYEDQLEDLVELAEEGIDEGKNEFKKMNELYEKEDLDGLLNLMLKEEGFKKKYKDILLDQRNKNWIPLIEKITKETPSFIGVGAMHLPGKLGVINLLRERGYTVEAVY